MKAAIKPDPHLAAAVRRLRHERGITQEGLAFEANLTVASMSRIERCVTNPAWTTLQAVSTALGIKPHELAHAAEGAQEGGDK